MLEWSGTAHIAADPSGSLLHLQDTQIFRVSLDGFFFFFLHANECNQNRWLIIPLRRSRRIIGRSLYLILLS
jgi:hypothetical protein